VPHKEDDPTHVFTIDEMAGGVAPHLYDYLEPYLGRMRSRSMYRGQADAQTPWALSGPTMHLHPHEFVVATRYIAGGSLPAAAVLSPQFRSELGRVTVQLPNNKSNVIFTPVEDEAYYLAGWINSSAAQSQIARFAASTGITPRVLEYLPIAPFDDSNQSHKQIAELARQATYMTQKVGSVAPEVELELDECVRAASR
jgi:hypothetical protein